MKLIIISLAAVAAVVSIGAAASQQSDSLAQHKATADFNFKQLALATIMYSSDYDDYLPKGKTLAQVKSEIMPYCKNSKIFVSQNPYRGQIKFNANLSGVSDIEIMNPADAPIFYDGKAWPDGGRPVAFSDGHVRFESAEGWKPVAKELKRKYKRTPKAR